MNRSTKLAPQNGSCQRLVQKASRAEVLRGHPGHYGTRSGSSRPALTSPPGPQSRFLSVRYQSRSKMACKMGLRHACAAELYVPNLAGAGERRTTLPPLRAHIRAISIQSSGSLPAEGLAAQIRPRRQWRGRCRRGSCCSRPLPGSAPDCNSIRTRGRLNAIPVHAQ